MLASGIVSCCAWPHRFLALTEKSKGYASLGNLPCQTRVNQLQLDTKLYGVVNKHFPTFGIVVMLKPKEISLHTPCP